MSEAADNHSEPAEIARDMFEVVPGVKLPLRLMPGRPASSG